MKFPREPVWHAGRLVQWGLRPLARPAQEPEYGELIERYFGDSVFRTTVKELADGLGLHVLDASEHGLVLAPHEESIFALRPGDFRPGSSKVDDRLLDGLAQIAIAGTVFPRARDLDEQPDMVRPPVTVEEIETQLRQLCERLSRESRGLPDPDASDESRGLIEAWRVYLQRLDTIATRDSRKAMRTTRRIIEYSLERLRDFGCFTQVTQGKEQAWQPTRRYQVMVQQLAGTSLFQFVRETLEVPRGALDSSDGDAG